MTDNCSSNVSRNSVKETFIGLQIAQEESPKELHSNELQFQSWPRIFGQMFFFFVLSSWLSSFSDNASVVFSKSVCPPKSVSAIFTFLTQNS